MSNPTSRRFFLGAATAAAATRVWGANDKINVAIIGLGGRGSNHLDIYSKLPGARVAGLCDVDQASREKAQATLARNGGEKAKEFEDMRQAFSDGGVEAVSIATPNHWHALATIWACKAGKDVYCEKPASYNIHEGLKMLQVARETKKMVQIGSQHRSNPMKIKAMEAVKGGLIGKVYQAKGLCYKRRVSIGHKDNEPTPPGVNWDLFLGPAPMRPFNALRFKYNWHWFWDTGNGDIGNQGVHEMGIARWGMGDPEWPKSVVCTGGKFAYNDDQETPNTQHATFDFGGRELVFEVRGLLTNGEGVPPPVPVRRPRPGEEVKPAPPVKRPENALNVMVGDIFFGTEGWMAMSDQGVQAYKGESNELIYEERPVRRGADAGGDGGDPTRAHMENFLSACRSRNEKELHDGIANASLSAAMCHLANISYRVGRKLTIEAGPKFTGDAVATSMITREKYRAPYVV
ncbi:MAG TPA: Gfo/Idh/MocA family oxidoreductase [Bryobacteraceae bacterium]|nr:Gfo/Idh/MocA family oxidoreductase [Bryobacteraceae bacterium]